MEVQVLRKAFLFVCFWMACASSLLSQLREFSIAEMPRPEVTVVQANAQFPDDALILVYSSLRDLNFRSSLGKIDKVSFNANANRYEVLVSPVKQMLFVYAPSFIELKFTTLNPNPKDVYYFKIEEKRDVPTQAATGLLRIITQPSGAEVSLNGNKFADKTPFKGSFPEAVYNLKLAKAKHLSLDTLIFVQGDDTTVYSFNLKPSTVWMNFNSSPSGASVFIRDQNKGITPLSLEFDLSTLQRNDTLPIVLKQDGYNSVLDTILVKPSRNPLNLNYTLAPLRGLTEIISSPEGAEVFINGAYKGATPFTDSLPVGNYNAYLMLEGYKKQDFQFVIDTGGVVRKMFELQEIEVANSDGEEEAPVNSELIPILDNTVTPTVTEPIRSALIPLPSDFPTVSIGRQVWMARNLNTSVFANGDSILEVNQAKNWKNHEGAAWAFYNGDEANESQHGRLYNWYAVSDKRGLCPTGWRVPNQADWEELIENVGGRKVGGKYIKDSKSWQENKASLNSFGMGIVPSGFRNYYGSYFNMGYYGSIWTLNESNFEDALYVYLYYGSDSINSKEISKKSGLSVRCIQSN
jgi:uncharacterized protein (TIGR02145 family)